MYKYLRHGYLQIISIMGRVLGKDFTLTDNKDENFKYLRVKRNEMGITITVSSGTQYKIFTLS